MPVLSIPLCFSQVPAQPIHFLWHPYIPLGKITLLAADPGLGKSTLTLSLAALLSNAHPLPSLPPSPNLNPNLNRKPLVPNEDPSSAPADKNAHPLPSPYPDAGQTTPPPSSFPAATVFLSPEDNLSDTIRPRLDALGANLAHIHSLRYFPPLYPTPDYPDPITHLRETIENIPHLKLLVIDPITHYLGHTDRRLLTQHNSALSALAALAEDLDIAILLTTRLTKRIPSRASRRSLIHLFGSLAFAAIARSVILLTQHPSTPNRRLLVPIKSNLTALPPPLSLTFQSPSVPNLNPNLNLNQNDQNPLPVPPSQSSVLPPQSSLHFDPTPLDPESLTDLLSDPKPDKAEPCLLSAQQFLEAALSEGPTKVIKITEAAELNRIAPRTLERAKAALSIRAIKHPQLRKWYWSLPNDTRPFRTGPYDHFPIGLNED